MLQIRTRIDCIDDYVVLLHECMRSKGERRADIPCYKSKFSVTLETFSGSFPRPVLDIHTKTSFINNEMNGLDESVGSK